MRSKLPFYEKVVLYVPSHQGRRRRRFEPVENEITYALNNLLYAYQASERCTKDVYHRDVYVK